jgi:hypothetical protein
MGLNGFVWVSAGMTVERREGGEGFDAEGVYSDKNDVSVGSGICGSQSAAFDHHVPGV